MSSVAQKFLEELRNGDQTQAIETIKESLRENAHQKIEESRQDILEEYGFVLDEKSKDYKKMEEEESEEGEEMDDDDDEE